MIVPTIRYFSSPDLEDLERGTPADPDDFVVLVQMMVGPSGGEGEESFDVEIVASGRLTHDVTDHGLVTGEHRLFVASFDWPLIAGFLRRRVAACTGRDWPEVARRIGRFARWELEDYRP